MVYVIAQRLFLAKQPRDGIIPDSNFVRDGQMSDSWHRRMQSQHCRYKRYVLCSPCVFDSWIVPVCMCMAVESPGACSDQIHDGFPLNRPSVAINRFFYGVLDGSWKFLGRKKNGITWSKWTGLRESEENQYWKFSFQQHNVISV